MALRTVTLELDEDDYRAVMNATARRQSFRVDGQCALPDYESSLLGVLVAEVCRGWMEFIDLSKREK